MTITQTRIPRPMSQTRAPRLRQGLRLPALLCLLAAAVTLSGPARAGSDGEREALARLAHEIDWLEPLIREAQAQAPGNARIRFRYDWLRADLARIRQGIMDHIEAPRGEPRPIPPLRGDYRR